MSNNSDIYYKVRKGSEAHNAIENFFDEEMTYNKELSKAIKKLGGDPKNVYKYNDGTIAGIWFDKKPPEGWKKMKGHYGYYLPYARNKEAWSVIPKRKDFSGSKLAEILFNKVPSKFEGMRLRSGCGVTTAKDTYYVNHVDVDDIKPVLKGMRVIKKSTFIKETEEE